MQTADTAASMVKVTYSNILKPVTDLKEAITNKSFYPGSPKPTIVGTPDGKTKIGFVLSYEDQGDLLHLLSLPHLFTFL